LRDWIVALVTRAISRRRKPASPFRPGRFFEPLYMVSAIVLYGIGKPRAILVAMWSSIVLFFDWR
jgi:hypothetical protein